MKKIASYVKAKTEKCLAIHDEYQDDFHYIAFGQFLSTSAEKHYKNEKMLAFFQDLNTTSIIGVMKEELVEYLETIKKGYVRARLQNNPVNFSTNPMANLIRLWDFEFYGEMIKEIDILLSKI
jgi:hypothetical protein